MNGTKTPGWRRRGCPCLYAQTKPGMQRMFFWDRGNLRGSLENRPSAWKTQVPEAAPGQLRPVWPLCHCLRLSSCNTDGHEGGSAVPPRAWGAGPRLRRERMLSPCAPLTMVFFKDHGHDPHTTQCACRSSLGAGRACGCWERWRGGSAADTRAVSPKDALLSPPGSCVFSSSQSGTTATNEVRAAGQS